MLQALDFDTSKAKPPIASEGLCPQTPWFNDLLLGLALSQKILDKKILILDVGICPQTPYFRELLLFSPSLRNF